MYKWLLCWRYLRTRFLAMVCIVSVMLGVATLIVVNSVMSGFSTKLQDRLHGLMSDVVIESADFQGFDDAEGKMRMIENDPELADKIEAMAPTLEVYAMLQFKFADEVPITQPVRLIGIDPKSRGKIGGFKEFLCSEKNRENPSFDLDDEAARRHAWNHRFDGAALPQPDPILLPGQKPPPDPPPSDPHVARGAFVGHAIAHRRKRDVQQSDKDKDVCMLNKGDDIYITTVSGAKLAPVYDRFVVSDYIKTEMSEYDSNYVYVPLDHLQKLRAMEGRVTSIQIKLKNYKDAPFVVKRLKQLFPEEQFAVQTWEDKQGPLLEAIRIEKGILNVLLFMIVAVAGFGILAIFSMIVVEKTRDIGILKALGASNGGIMKIFLGYGLLLGTVGSLAGTVLGIVFTIYINEIEEVLARLTGEDVFNRNVYYFDRIPTDIQPLSVVLVNVGAIAIAVTFSVLPALRAAMLHPVRALRYE